MEPNKSMFIELFPEVIFQHYQNPIIVKKTDLSTVTKKSFRDSDGLHFQIVFRTKNNETYEEDYAPGFSNIDNEEEAQLVRDDRYATIKIELCQ